MKIIDFVKKLLPHIDKADVLEDIEVTTTELTTGAIPCYQSATVYFKTADIKAANNKDIIKVFYRNYELTPRKRKDNIVADINDAFINIRANLDYLSEEIENLFTKDIIKDGLTLRKAVLLRTAEHISFITRYSIDILNLIYVNEAVAKKADLEEGFKGNDHFNKLTNKNLYVFARLLYTYNVKLDTFKQLMGRSIEITVNERTIDNIVAAYKEEEVDPLGSAVVQEFEYNPIYHIRLIIAEWQADRYKGFKDKKKMLELRLLHLRSLEQGSDPKLEKEIEYIQDRVTTIEYKMSKMEQT